MADFLRAALREAFGIPSPSRLWSEAWASAFQPTALGALQRRIVDSGSGFVDFMIDATPGGREATDAETRRIVARAEAEGAALIGAIACPLSPRGWDHSLDAAVFARCPFCGAVV